MEDLSLHVLDIAENGIGAGADRIVIECIEDPETNRLEIVITDNGKGMDPEMAAKVTDPFVTTRTTRKVGLGIPMLKASATETGGDAVVESEKGKGTVTRAWFFTDHIDCRPVGNMADSLTTLILGNHDVEFFFSWKRGGECFEVDTVDLQEQLGDVPLTEPQVLVMIRGQIETELEALRKGSK